MTGQQPPTDASSALEVSVRASIEGVRNLQAEVATLRSKLERSEASLAMEAAKADQAEAALAQVEALRDHYMRRTVELEVCLTTMQGLLADAIQRGKGTMLASAKPPKSPAAAEGGTLDVKAIGKKFGAGFAAKQDIEE